MADQLTDIDGIGAKTAEDLREEGIGTPDELGDAYLRQDPVVTGAGKRVQRGARDALLNERDSFTDPVSGAEIDESNRFAFEKLGTRTIGETSSVSSRASENLGSDTEFRELVDPVRRGEFFNEVGDNYDAMEFAANAAGNITDDELSTGQLIDLNQASRTRDEELTLRKKTGSGKKTKPQGDVRAGGLFRALSVHQNRSAEAQFVDENREAEETKSFEKWQSAPSRYDYPGVDTKMGLGTFFPEERSYKKRGSFGISTRTNRDRDKLKDAAEGLERLDDEQQRRLFGEERALEFDLERALRRE